jgi:2-polyprenyl-3-methyl-5-hydroxy-6-metoxy-1,4-benzoquinol methylase
MAGYAIRGGKEGKERLDLLARVTLPTTSQLLNAVGIGKGMRCLDVGCGGGHVTLLMARLVEPEGKVVGTDMDGEVIALARKDAVTAKLDNVEFRRADAAMCQATGEYDLVYARFLLSHLSEPEKCLEAVVTACNVKGLIVLEDVDFAGSFCYPFCAAYERYTQLYQDVVSRRGGDANIGPKLPGMLRKAGAKHVQLNVVQPTHVQGEGKLMASITMQRIAGAVISERLATESEVQQIITELNDAAADSKTIMSLPRIFQVWGRRAYRKEVMNLLRTFG